MGPNYPTIVNSEIWRDLQRSCNGCWLDKSEVDKRITLPGGGSITVKSADNPDSLRGAGLDGVVVDEAAFLSVDAWENAIRPALADKQGWAILASTPNGRNWYYDRYRKAVDGREGWMAWRLPSAQNPLMTEKELADAKEEMGPRKFAQEHEAEPMEVEGAMWPFSFFDENKIWCSEDDWPDVFEHSAIAIDPSLAPTEVRTKSGLAEPTSDYSAIVFVGLSRGLIWVDADIKRRSPGQIVLDGVRMYQRHRPRDFGVESNYYQSVLSDLFDIHCMQNHLAPLPICLINNHTKKEVRIETLDSHLARFHFRFRRTPGCKMLVEQLMMFPLEEYKRDGPDALEMAVRLLDDQGSLVEPVEEYVTA